MSNQSELPDRSRRSFGADQSSNDGVSFKMYPAGNNSIIISVKPPDSPSKSIDHVSCDIVLVIDTSGSMHEEAPVPGASSGSRESDTGLSLLDLTKHAAKTIVETLNEKDRLGIVTYSSEAKVS
jgi:hypothetical protein